MPIPKHGYLFSLLISICFSTGWAQYSPLDLQKETDALFTSGAYAEAMSGYAQLLSLEPTNPEYNYKYGATALYGDPSKREEAIKYLKFASGKGGVEPLVWYFLGRAYHLNYQFADAVQAYLKFAEKAPKKQADDWQVARVIEMAGNGKGLLSSIKEVTVLDKKQADDREFFRYYDLSHIGGKILVTPQELLSSLDIKRNHRSLMHFRGSGTTVYFSSYGKDGKTGLDIYSAEVLPGGTFSSPKLLPGTVNTPYDEDFPYLHPDGRTFYFSSKGHSSMGGYDVFRSSFDAASGAFGSPQNMDFAINTPDDDIFYIADSLNQYANFASGRSSKQGQLHVYQVRVQMAPVNLTLVKGVFSNRINPGLRTTKITARDAATNKTVDVQYSDPNNGDYLLSFPKSGRYKILVEAQNSDRVHSGMVEIPHSDAMSAFVQELELIAPSGIEKLIINNRFDQKYEGDLSALLQEMLRKRAELEVNFDQVEEPEEVSEVVEDAPNLALAYNAAGFGAGLSNERVVGAAVQRVEQLQASADALLDKKNSAAAEAGLAFVKAQQLLAEAKTKASIDPQSDGGAASFEAAVAQYEAQLALEKARVATELSVTLHEKYKELQANTDAERGLVENLQTEVASGDYDRVLAALKQQNERLRTQDKVSTRVDMVAEISLAGKDARAEADKAMRRAIGLRNESESLVGDRNNKQRQLERSKGKAAADLQTAIERLNDEIADIQKVIANAYSQASEKEAIAARYGEQVALLQNLPEVQGSESSEGPATADISTLDGDIKVIRIDKKAAEAFLIKRPDALAAIGTGNTLREFQTVTGVGTYSIEEALALQENSNNYAAAQSKSPGRTASDQDQSPGAKEKTEGTMVQVDESQIARVSKSSSEGLSEVARQVTGLEENAQYEVAATLPDTARVAQAAGIKNNAASTVEDGDITEATSNEKAGDVKLARSSEIQSKNDIQRDLEEANDWVKIIEESMAEIADAAAAGDADAVAQQESYQQLLDEKRVQVAELKTQIAEVGADLELPERMALALEEALADVAELDINLITRLESKFNEASSSPSFVSDLNKVDNTYIDALTAVETSGKSAPEIAAERVALNTKLIAELSTTMQSPGVTEIDRDRLLEIKRIKTLEVQDDRLVMEGRSNYEPRSAEAMAYAAMLAKAGEDESENGFSQTGVDNSKEIIANELSPALRDALEKPYSWDDVVPGYIDLVGQTLTEKSSPQQIEKRIEAHKAMLLRLKDDISIFSILVESGEAPDTRVRLRYEQLLTERNNIADALSEDKKLLDKAILYQDVADDITKGKDTGLDEANLAGASPMRLRADTLAGQVETFIAIESSKLEEAYAKLKNSGNSTSAKLTEMARLNKAMANAIGIEIDALIAFLDEADDEVVQDKVQLEIQKLDAVLADKLQEVDRLTAEAESAEMITMAQSIPATQQEQSPAMNGEDSAQIDNERLELASMQIANMPPISVEDLTYKSLYASMSIASLEKADNEAKQQRTEAKILSEAYRNAASSEERKQIFEQIEKASNRVIRADIELNKAVKQANALEANFYLSSIEAYYTELNTTSTADNAQAQALYEETARTEQAIRALHSQRDELDAFDTETYADILREEKQLIDNLEKVLSGFEALSSSVAAVSDAAKKDEASDTEAGITTRPDAPRAVVLPAEVAVLSAAEADTSTPEFIQSEQTVAAASTSQPKADSVDSVVAISEQERSDRATADEPSDGIEPKEGTVPAELEEHEPIEGYTYLTPALLRSAEYSNPESVQRFMETQPLLTTPLEFARPGSPEERVATIANAQILAPEILEKIKESNTTLVYVSSVAIADSLKGMERRHVELLRTTYGAGQERSDEAARLRSMLPLESNLRNRQSMLERAERIEQEAAVYYSNAATVALRAEDLRTARKANEQMIAQSAQALGANEINVLNNLMGTKAYTVITTDLISDDLGALDENAAVRGKPAETPISQWSSDAPMGKPASPAATSTPTEAVMTAGNWLAMVEIIAEKTDFSDVRETMFVIADKSVYSAEKPIPVDPEMPKGLVFQVQVGAFRKPISQDLFGEIAPLMGQKLDNGITRYRAGLFREYTRAIEARDVIRNMGFRDAFVVAYVDGEKLTSEQARTILAQAAALPEAAPMDQTAASSERAATANMPMPNEGNDTIKASAPSTAVKTSTETATVDYYADPEAAEAVQVEVVQGLFYTVQVGVYSKPVKLDQLYNLSNLNSELTEKGLIRYTSGRFSSLAEAGNGKQDAIAAGVGDAFITAYYNGRRISLREAAEVLEREGSKVLELSVLNRNTPTIPNDTAQPENSTKSVNDDRPLQPGQTGSSDSASTADGADTKAVDAQGVQTYVVVLGQFGREVPDYFASFMLNNSDLGIRKIEGPSGQAMYISPEFSKKESAEDFLALARAAGLSSALLGTSVNGQIMGLEAR